MSILMFLIFLEIPIVITAAVAVTEDLGGLDIVGWLVASYLLGYIGE
jgi:MFS family permease